MSLTKPCKKKRTLKILPLFFLQVLNPWYFFYQPVSHRLDGRLGSFKDLRAMIDVCRSVGVRVYVVVSRSISPPWGSIRLRPALRTYAPWGCIVRVVSQVESEKYAPQTFYRTFYGQVRRRRRQPHDGTRHEPFNSTPVGVNSVSPGSPHVCPVAYVW